MVHTLQNQLLNQIIQFLAQVLKQQFIFYINQPKNVSS